MQALLMVEVEKLYGRSTGILDCHPEVQFMISTSIHKNGQPVAILRKAMPRLRLTEHVAPCRNGQENISVHRPNGTRGTVVQQLPLKRLVRDYLQTFIPRLTIFRRDRGHPRDHHTDVL